MTEKDEVMYSIPKDRFIREMIERAYRCRNKILQLEEPFKEDLAEEILPRPFEARARHRERVSEYFSGHIEKGELRGLLIAVNFYIDYLCDGRGYPDAHTILKSFAAGIASGEIGITKQDEVIEYQYPN